MFWAEPLAQSAALFVLTCAVFLRVSTFEFLNQDDAEYVYENAQVWTGLSLQNAAWAFRSLNGGISYWHPLTWLSHQLDCQLFGLRPGPHHLTNLWIHTGGVLLLLVVLRQLQIGSRAAFFAAGLFAVHPLHVESVAWVAERKDVLFASFWLLSLSAYLRFRQSGAAKWYGWAILSFAMALMSKPAAVTLPVILILLEQMHLIPPRAPAPGRGVHRSAVDQFNTVQLLLVLSPFLLMSFALGVMTLLAQAEVGALQNLDRWPLSERLDNALISYALYFKKALMPVDLCVSYVQTKPYGPLALLSAATGIGGISLAAVRVRRSEPWILGGWLWFTLTLIPNIGLVQTGPQSMADRYMYVPVIGVFLMCAGTARAAALRWGREQLLNWIGVTALVFCSTASYWQLQYWANSVSLFSRAAALNPDNWFARLGLGMALAQQRRFSDALPHLQHALTLPGNRSATHKGLGICFQGNGDSENALRQFELALQHNSSSADLCLLIAEILAKDDDATLRDTVRAVVFAERGCRLRRAATPRDLLTLSAAYSADGRRQDAAKAVERAAALAWATGRDELEPAIRERLAELAHPKGGG